VHGDFVGKNIRIRSGPRGYTLLPFDWGDAGWGIPAVDLAQAAHPYPDFSASPGVPTYCALMRQQWPRIPVQTIERLANCGTLFRCVAALDWEAHDLVYPWRDAALRHMAVYGSWIDTSVRTMKMKRRF
jgi:aminoglycoside phosphotransferase (APT) family kinase protein